MRARWVGSETEMSHAPLPHRQHPGQPDAPAPGTGPPPGGQPAPRPRPSHPLARPAGGLTAPTPGLAALRVCNSRRRKCAIQIGVDTPGRSPPPGLLCLAQPVMFRARNSIPPHGRLYPGAH
jgi:hypothetical protein